MTAQSAPVAARPLGEPIRGQGSCRQGFARFRRTPLGVTFATVVLFLALLALAAPLVSRYVTHIDPTQQDLTVIFGPLGTKRHLLGTAELGRDVFTRLIWGSRVSLGVGFLTVTLYLLIGGTFGPVAGFYGGLCGEGPVRSRA